MSVTNIKTVENATHYKRIRIAFIQNGTSLHAWCELENIAMQNARAAILGIWSGPKATELVNRIELASGLRKK